MISKRVIKKKKKDATARINREIAIMKMLKHPHVVVVRIDLNLPGRSGSYTQTVSFNGAFIHDTSLPISQMREALASSVELFLVLDLVSGGTLRNALGDAGSCMSHIIAFCLPLCYILISNLALNFVSYGVR